MSPNFKEKKKKKSNSPKENKIEGIEEMRI